MGGRAQRLVESPNVLPPGRRKEIPALTGVRGLAALWVFFYHALEHRGRMLGASQHPSHFFDSGETAVDLFFVLSGFILAYVHLRDFREIRFAALRRFFLLRVFRIYPLHLTILAGMALLVHQAPDYARFAEFIRDDPATFTRTGFVLSCLLIQNWGFGFTHGWNGPAWSISAELLGYLTFPMLASAVLRVRNEWFCILGSLSVMLVLGLFLKHWEHAEFHGNITRSVGLLRMLVGFPAGVLLYRFTELQPVESRVLALLGFCGIMIGSIFPVWEWLIYPALPFLILGLSRPNDWLARIVGWWPVEWLGRISFSLYLLHIPLLWLVHWCFGPVPAFLALPVILLASWIMHLAIERPGREIGRRLLRQYDTNSTEPHAAIGITQQGGNRA